MRNLVLLKESIQSYERDETNAEASLLNCHFALDSTTNRLYVADRQNVVCYQVDHEVERNYQRFCRRRFDVPSVSYGLRRHRNILAVFVESGSPRSMRPPWWLTKMEN